MSDKEYQDLLSKISKCSDWHTAHVLVELLERIRRLELKEYIR